MNNKYTLHEVHNTKERLKMVAVQNTMERWSQNMNLQISPDRSMKMKVLLQLLLSKNDLKDF